MEKTFILKGNICYSEDQQHLHITEQGYLICIDGISAGVYQELPEKYQGIRIYDYGDNIIIPGLTDLHVHAPQYSFRALDMDLELIEWLDKNTFPEEAKYRDIEYAKRAYQFFTEDLTKGATVNAGVFATIHPDATELLMDLLDKNGIRAVVGKVNMDRNASAGLNEENAGTSARRTREWLDRTMFRYSRVKPILTPRFIPSCSDRLMRELAEIQQEYKLPLQTHLSENPGEIEWVAELCPESESYGDAYDQFGLFGNIQPAIMAHCVYPVDKDLELMKKRDIYVAHCPASNTNLSSGIAPVRTYLDEGIKVGLGTDIAGGFSLSVFRAMAEAVQVSKLRWRLVDQSQKPLTVEEAFYMGTKGGGAFFGKSGSLEAGYHLDAVILKDDNLPSPRAFTVRERLERLIYLSDERNILRKYICGEPVI